MATVAALCAAFALGFTLALVMEAKRRRADSRHSFGAGINMGRLQWAERYRHLRSEGMSEEDALALPWEDRFAAVIDAHQEAAVPSTPPEPAPYTVAQP